MEKLAQELVDRIFRYLPARSIITASNVLKLKHDPHHASYIEIWASIFKDETWLRKAIAYNVNPLLLGSDLVNDSYMFLVAQDNTGDLQLWEQNQTAFLGSLQEHTFDEKTQEVKFRSGLVLNVYGVLCSAECNRVPLSKLFPPHLLRPARDVQLSYMFLEDEEKRLRTLSGDNIRGLRKAKHRRENRIPKMHPQYLSLICGLNIRDLQGNDNMYLFRAPESDKSNLRPYFANNRDSGYRQILGWDKFTRDRI